MNNGNGRRRSTLFLQRVPGIVNAALTLAALWVAWQSLQVAAESRKDAQKSGEESAQMLTSITVALKDQLQQLKEESALQVAQIETAEGGPGGRQNAGRDPIGATEA